MTTDFNNDTDDDREAAGERGPPEPAKREAAPTGTLARGLAIVDVLLSASQPLTLAEISEAVGLDQSTALRLIRSLEELGQLIRIGDGKRYVCSPKALKPMPILHPLERLRREVAPLINGLATRSGQSVVLVAYLGTNRVVLDVALTQGSLSPYYTAWLKGPFHGSGPGKALLSALDPARRRELLGEEPFRAYTPRTITTYAGLDADLARAKERGFVTIRDEFYLGLSALAAVFRTWNGGIAGAIAVTGHTTDMTDERIAAIGADLVAVTRLIPMQAPSLTLLEPFCAR
ncbi:IclR family transcriptional regulator [Acuticoccus sediminis]|uniref:IclR family transcriptional regulator n=1 Tax=Acuticoccus sediminis TaxID=2184697 RepID=UPI001390CF24|nr:IclR family transcriptional regulator [Acuticoccus sediminis]